MQKIGTIYKKTVESEFKKRLNDISSVFVVKFSGLKASELTELRNNLSQTKSRFFVVKNSLSSRILKDSDLKELVDILQGQTAFIFGYDDPILICKAISDFAKAHAALEFQGGILEKRLVKGQDLGNLVNLPSKDQLRAKFVYCIKAPLNNMVYILNGVLRKPIYAINAIKDKKSKS
ncbi:MAG: 50S ribosomal protein L10 [Candidatus Omnitrophica bacterium CG11_big_fil_rev_8_21_14_0_20_42_13]|uniref:Large ribosomal subunit protein uL10 n=1 Tax=Candidatus Ghiorseimicrobium undicola TaxID=1974746 RepID=A0A2H0LVC4_9BACT|nr:MAG: 50S ribosomal protein L10 [Candidatus Omnitrophica bacterium CG11_big_fil_rev_8_21_14_0_20_42_13]